MQTVTAAVEKSLRQSLLQPLGNSREVAYSVRLERETDHLRQTQIPPPNKKEKEKKKASSG